MNLSPVLKGDTLIALDADRQKIREAVPKRLCLVEALGETVVAFLIVSLVEGDMGIFG